MNKRGQFYLIAAIIILIILIGLSNISSNLIIRPKSKTLKNFKDDLNRESYKIIEHAIYNKKDLDFLLTKFAGDQFGEYFLQKTKNANIIYLYGNIAGLKALQYNRGPQGEVSLGSANWYNYNNFAKIKEINKDEISNENYIELIILNNSYPFPITDNQMFYFVIVEEDQGEIFIEIS